MSKGGFASLSHFYEIDRIPYFDIRYSLFQSFFSDQTGRLRPAAVLNSEPQNLEPVNGRIYALKHATWCPGLISFKIGRASRQD